MALRAVKAGEASKSRAAKSVSDAAANGTPRELLVAMRARIARAVESDSTSARDLAALSRQLQDIVREIHAIDAREEQEATQHAAATDGAFDPSAV